MRYFLTIVLTIMALQASAGDALVEKAMLQAAMQRHIERNLVDGAILHINPDDGAIERLYPSETHPQVFAADGYYVLCVDLKSADGQARPADFYIAPRADGFLVIRSEIDNRNVLRKLMAGGGVHRLN